MSNYPEAMAPGEEDGPPNLCDHCGHPIIWPAVPHETDRGMFCQACMDGAWPGEPGDPEVEPFEFTCAECGTVLSPANANWDEEGGCYVCDECWTLPPAAEEVTG